MHALGIWHEQMRPDRDQYVKILFENVKPEHKHNFDKLNRSGWKSINKGTISEPLRSEILNTIFNREQAMTQKFDSFKIQLFLYLLFFGSQRVSGRDEYLENKVCYIDVIEVFWIHVKINYQKVDS